VKVFYDTEFLDDGKTIELISIGMVRDDGAEYYAVNLEMDWNRIVQHEWLRKNVVPHLPQTPVRLDGAHPDVKTRTQIRNDISSFLHISDKVQLWAWYGAYDFVALCQLWGTMMELPDHIPSYSNDIRQVVNMMEVPFLKLPKQLQDEHHALADAKFNRIRYEWLLDYVDSH
jgi:hypothetical protein